jgi:uncharacterized membrane protein YkvA (DUF1232 family)
VWWSIALSVTGGLALVWVALLIALWSSRPDEPGARAALRLLPDVVRLIKALAADPDLPRAVRIRLGLLLVYLALPFDLVPDFVPVIGYADDAVVVAITLRSVTRRAGSAALARHWQGTPEGLAAIRRFSGIAAAN